MLVGFFLAEAPAIVRVHLRSGQGLTFNLGGPLDYLGLRRFERTTLRPREMKLVRLSLLKIGRRLALAFVGRGLDWPRQTELIAFDPPDDGVGPR